MGNREAVMDSITFSPFSEATYNILPPGFHKELKCIIHQYLARYWTVLGLKKLRGSSHRTSPANIRMSRGDRASHLPSSKCSNTQNTFLWRWNSKNFERWEAKKGQIQEGGVIETNPWLVNSLASERMADQHTSLLSNMAALASSLF